MPGRICLPRRSPVRLATALVAGLFVQTAIAQASIPELDDQYRIVNSVAFAPDGNTMYFAVLYHHYLEAHGRSVDGEPETALFVVHRQDGAWGDPEMMPFSGRYQDYEPTLTDKGRLMVFNSSRPYADGRMPEVNDLWMSRMDDSGKWSAPERLDGITSFEFEESYGTLTADGDLVFLQGYSLPEGGTGYDLYVAEYRNGEFRDAVRHPVSTDRWGEADPCIAADGSFVIFTRWDDEIGWRESVDLYIAFAEPDGWSEPVPLTELNTEGPDYGAAISADGEWLHYRANGRFRTVGLEAVLSQVR